MAERRGGRGLRVGPRAAPPRRPGWPRASDLAREGGGSGKPWRPGRWTLGRRRGHRKPGGGVGTGDRPRGWGFPPTWAGFVLRFQKLQLDPLKSPANFLAFLFSQSSAFGAPLQGNFGIGVRPGRLGMEGGGSGRSTKNSSFYVETCSSGTSAFVVIFVKKQNYASKKHFY